MADRPIYTRVPRVYVTGGEAAIVHTGVALDYDWFCAMPADSDWLDAGGPIDAPDMTPSGRIKVWKGVRFFELLPREGW